MGVRKKTSNQIPMSHQNEAEAGQSEVTVASCQIHEPASEDQPLTPRERIWQVVAAIPCGCVASYGQVARLAGLPRRGRLVGRTLRDLPDDTRLPWHRVVNAGLSLSPRGDPSAVARQRARLEAEGVTFIGARVAPEHRWEH